MENPHTQPFPQMQHVNVKLLVRNPQEVDLEPLIPVFHGWIQEQVGEGLLLDNADHRLGVRYNRKAALDGSNQDRLKQATRAALTACQRLEGDPRLGGRLRFNGQEIEIFVNDRLLAPNCDAIREAFNSDFQIFFQNLFRGSEYSMSYGSDPRKLFTVSVKAAQPFPLADLLEKLD